MPGRQPITGPPSIDRCPSAVVHMRQAKRGLRRRRLRVSYSGLLSHLALRALYRTGLYLPHVGPAGGDLRKRTSDYFDVDLGEASSVSPRQREAKETTADIKISRYQNKIKSTAETQYCPSSDPKRLPPCTADPKGHVYPTCSTPIHPLSAAAVHPTPGLARYY